jgi:hypothetical protein
MREFELESGEHAVKEVRKHWFIFLIELLPYAILFVLPFTIPPVFSLLNQSFWEFIPWSDAWIRLLLAVYFLAVWCGTFKTFTRYYLNLWVVTNHRIVDVRQKGFFDREVSSLLLNRVQDVMVDTEGVMFSLLDIGDIFVQSAGATERFRMRGIPHPAELRDVILKYVSEKEKASV